MLKGSRAPRQSLSSRTRLTRRTTDLTMNCEEFTQCVMCVVQCWWSERVNRPPTCTPNRDDPAGTIKFAVKPGGHCFPPKPDEPNVTVVAGYSLTHILSTAIVCMLVGVALLWIYYEIRRYASRQFYDFHADDPERPRSPPPRPHTYAARWVRNQAKDRVRQIAQLMGRRPQSIESLVEEVDEEDGRPAPVNDLVRRREPNALLVNNDVALQVGDDGDDDDDHIEFRIIPRGQQQQRNPPQVRPPAALRRIMRASPQEILERRNRLGRRKNIYARD